MKRYQLVLSRHGLDDFTYNLVKPIFKAKDENDAIKIANSLQRKLKKDDYDANQFLYAVLSSAELDLDSRYN